MTSAAWGQVTGFVAVLDQIMADSALAQAGQSVGGALDVTAVLWLAALFGAIGGVVYELIALQGNIELPHRTDPDELPKAGYTLAKKASSLLDLGVVARVFIGAAAALVALWALPSTAESEVIAVSLVAGAAGTSVFRSMQDRLLAALNAQKNETLQRAGKGLLENTERVLAEMQHGDPEMQQAELRDHLTEIRGQLRALVEIE